MLKKICKRIYRVLIDDSGEPPPETRTVTPSSRSILEARVQELEAQVHRAASAPTTPEEALQSRIQELEALLAAQQPVAPVTLERSTEDRLQAQIQELEDRLSSHQPREPKPQSARIESIEAALQSRFREFEARLFPSTQSPGTVDLSLDEVIKARFQEFEERMLSRQQPRDLTGKTGTPHYALLRFTILTLVLAI